MPRHCTHAEEYNERGIFVSPAAPPYVHHLEPCSARFDIVFRFMEPDVSVVLKLSVLLLSLFEGSVNSTGTIGTAYSRCPFMGNGKNEHNSLSSEKWNPKRAATKQYL